MTAHESERPENFRTYFVVAYILLLVGYFIWLTPLAALVMAIIKRHEVRGTIYQSHARNIIMIFVISLIGLFVGWILFWLFFVGWIIWIVVAVYVLYREVMGLIRVLDSRPF